MTTRYNTLDVPAIDLNKRIASVRARCALAGVSLVTSTDDRHDLPVFVVSKGALTLRFGTLAGVEHWLDARERDHA